MKILLVAKGRSHNLVERIKSSSGAWRIVVTMETWYKLFEKKEPWSRFFITVIVRWNIHVHTNMSIVSKEI